MKRSLLRKSLLLGMLCAGMTVALTACTSLEKSKEVSVVVESEMVENIQQTEPDVTEVIETETTETVIETENAEEQETEQTMEEWLTEVGEQGTICMAVWNDVNSAKHIIENGETYGRQDGDRFFMCTPSRVEENLSKSAIGYKLNKPADNYLEITLEDFLGEVNIEYDIICLGGEQGTIHFTLTYSETDSTNFTTVEPEIPGFQWAMHLEYDTSKIVVWNDTKGFKQVLDEGETYQLCEGDELAVYMPENYIYDSTNIGEGNVSLVANLVLVNWKEVELGDGFDFELITCNIETSEKVTTFVTLFPVQ